MMGLLGKITSFNGAYYAFLLQNVRKDINTESQGMLIKGIHILQDNFV